MTVHYPVRAIICACACALCLSMLAAGCAPQQEKQPSSQPSLEFADPSDVADQHAATTASGALADHPKEAPTPTERAAEKVAAMTLEQKVAQLFVVTPEAITGVEAATQAGPTTRDALQTYPVGGLVYFQKNLLDEDQTKTMLANTQSYAQEATGLPLFLAVDEEGGTVSRVGGNPGFSTPNVGDMAAVGATGDAAQAKDVATTIGTYLHDLGFNLDFAPDADICGDPATDVMAQRSFGTNPQAVANMVSAQVEGFSDAGILCCVKHFPGIGGVLGDSHNGTIQSEQTLDGLREKELVPFKAAIAADVPLVMVGHLSTPQATATETPASINPAIVTDLLRTELGFDNLVITDSLAMGAVSDVSPDQLGVRALQAGVDLVLMPADFPAAYQGVLAAVQNGTIAESRVDESVTRIVQTKLALQTR